MKDCGKCHVRSVKYSHSRKLESVQIIIKETRNCKMLPLTSPTHRCLISLMIEEKAELDVSVLYAVLS